MTSDATRRDSLPAPPETLPELGSAHANLDPARLPPATRAAPLKRAALRVLRLYTHGQVEFNRAVLGVLDRWDAHLRQLHGRLEAELARSAERLEKLEDAAIPRAELDERIYPLQVRTEDLETDVEELEERAGGIAAHAQRVERALAAHVEASARDSSAMQDRIGEEIRGLRERLDARAALEDAPVFARDDYFAFEERFRGSREEILRRQRFYLPFLREAAARGVEGARFLDLGCGRGELLELAARAGLAMAGWDCDPAMVLHCRALGLDAHVGDLFDALQSAENGSLAGITALQLIEHLPFPRIRELVELASRKLRPGGLLALETINPASWYAMRFFYADPTHRRPVPDATCKFLLEMSGFEQTEIHFLQPVAEEELRTVTGGDPRLEPVASFLMGYQDYAAIGRKP